MSARYRLQGQPRRRLRAKRTKTSVGPLRRAGPRCKARAGALAHGVHASMGRAAVRAEQSHKGRGVMAKRYGRPSAQYRYEHYDPRW